MFFKNSMDKTFDLQQRKQKVIKDLIKNDSRLKEISLNELINTISIYHTNKFVNSSKELYNSNDLIDVAKESKELLLKIFNMDELYKKLGKEKSYEIEKFEYNDDFRRKVMNASLYQIISMNGKEKGPEYGLIFAKMFNYSLELPMQYASYNGMFDERFIKYLDTYLGLNGSSNIYLLPNYFDDSNDKYYMEDLGEVIELVKAYLKANKVNSIN